MSSLDKTILIIEDDEGLQSQLKWHFDDFETTLVTASNVKDALTAIRLYQPNVVIQDLGLPPDPEGVTEGFRSIQEILSIAPNTKIVVLTGKNEHQNALKSIALGAFDYYNKPVDTDALDRVVEQAFKISHLEFENKQSQVNAEPISGIITSDSQIRNICRMVTKIAQTNITATLLGESGTGKEVLARAIHAGNLKPNTSFVAINCAAVPESLMESELFGHEKGAFTGAVSSTVGKIEQANGGTLFLDEIGDMPLLLQAKVLRFLQERTFEKVGGRKEISVDLRIVCATNKDLQEMVKDGTFREDLYYRICEIVVDIPPLRKRGNDSVLVAEHMLTHYAKNLSSKKMKFSSDAIEAISDYSWPGNIREVENKVKRAVVLAESSIVQVSDLDIPTTKEKLSVINLKEARKIAEVDAIQSALQISKNNISAAAKLLGVTRPTLYDIIKKHNLALEPNE